MAKIFKFIWRFFWFSLPKCDRVLLGQKGRKAITSLGEGAEHMLIRAGLLAMLLGWCSLSVAYLSAAEGGQWFSLAPMATSRQELAVAELDNFIFAIGGGSDVVEVYNPATNMWLPLRNLPVVVHHGVAIGLNGYIYHFGGSTFNGALRRAFVYDPSVDQWYDITPPRYQHGYTPAIAAIGGYIFLAGGWGDDLDMVGNEVEAYDPSTDTWIEVAPMSVGRNHIAGGVINGKFYVAGGRPGTLTLLEEYDPLTNRWTTKAPMPTGRSGVGAAVVNNCLYVFGGETPGIFREVEAYNPATDRWTRLAPMPTPRHGIMAVTIDNWIFIPGGGTQEGGAPTNVHEVFVVNVQ
jgi:hypothetical protein